MFVIRLLRALRGYVQFYASGVFLERFLNLAVRQGINIWNVSKQEESMSACTGASSYRSLRPLAKKTGLRLRVKERHGLPFLIRRYRKRLGLLCGALFFLFFLCGMGQFIWHIEVIGNKEVSTQKILTTLHEQGLKVGAVRRKLNAREMERSTLLKIQRLSWIAVNMDGSTATVEVHERVMPPPMFPDNDKPCNLVAARSGLIISMEIYEGQSILKVGDTVQQGDVIVSGIIEDKKLQTSYKHARGKVLAQTDYEIVIEVPRAVKKKVPSGKEKRRSYLRLFGTDLPLFIYHPFHQSYDIQRKVQPLYLFGFSLPLSLLQEDYSFYTMQEKHLSLQEAEKEALRLLEEKQQKELLQANILEKNIKKQGTDNMYKVNAKYICNIDIAKEQEISKNG